ncbi:hypothetical protein MLPF_3390 [Mycobacterium lepromatosis]|nr:hypothetical protein MLPF_3390 [Mycobacterium lepromatosis]
MHHRMESSSRLISLVEVGPSSCRGTILDIKDVVTRNFLGSNKIHQIQNSSQLVLSCGSCPCVIR